jgi:type II secretory pathway component HofQ
MAALLAVLAARGQSALAWLSASIVVWLVGLEVGFPDVLEAGLEGIPVLIAAASATAAALGRADEEIEELRTAEIAAESGIVAAAAASEERRQRLNQVLEKALPSLSYIAANKGQISEDQQRELLQLEASLRDEIRGRSLVNDAVRNSSNAARARGIEIVIMDEGGLNDLADTQREIILNRIAAAIDSVKSGKIVIRSPRGEQWLVTVMATRPGTSAPDLWLKL